MVVHELFLCLGGNLGKKPEIFRETITRVEKNMGKLLDASPVYQSPAWGFQSRFPFWNQVIKVETSLDPADILEIIKTIERHFGRNRQHGRYLSRKMDIDILFYDDRNIQTEELTIPHPLIRNRRFVLVPLHDIAPGFIHPVTGQTVAAMLADCCDPAPVIRVFPEV